MVENDISLSKIFGSNCDYGLFDKEKSILSIVSGNASRNVYSYNFTVYRDGEIFKSDKHVGSSDSYGSNGYRIDFHLQKSVF